MRDGNVVDPVGINAGAVGGYLAAAADGRGAVIRISADAGALAHGDVAGAANDGTGVACGRDSAGDSRYIAGLNGGCCAVQRICSDPAAVTLRDVARVGGGRGAV